MKTSDEVVRLVKGVSRELLKGGQTLSFAESCTGGLLSAALTSQPGASRVFAGGVVAYSAEVKNRILGVPWPQIQAFGEVSLPVARSMAQGVRRATQSHWAVSVTGIAGPGGGSAEKPVGTVCFGMVGPGIEGTQQVCFKGNTRLQIQLSSVEFALEFLWNKMAVRES